MAKNKIIGWCVLGLLGSVASAQGMTPAPVKVPFSLCSGNCVPVDFDECCEAVVTSCTRVDYGPVLINPGVPHTIVSSEIDCDNCYPDCPCCPESSGGGGGCADCDNLPAKQCLVDINLCWSSGTTYQISSGIQSELGVSGIAQIKASLRQTAGVSEQATICFTARCGFPAVMPCLHVSTTPFISGALGAVARYTHKWSASGAWATRDGCEDDPCPIAGFSWHADDCRMETSTVTGNPYFTAGCGTNTVHDCP